MKYIIILILLVANIYAAELILNRYEESNQSVDLYHVVDNKPVVCRQEYSEDFKTVIRCRFLRALSIDKNRRAETYFDIEITDDEIVFYSKAYAKLLPVNDRIIDADMIKKPLSYRHWIIIGSKKKPEVLDEKAKKRFNFPLQFKKEPPPYIGALDLNGQPIREKKDAISLTHIKKLFKDKKYRQIVKLSDTLASEYDRTFAGEYELYKLRALEKLAQDDRQLYFDLKTAALEWIGKNPSNRHIPEAYSYAAIGSFGLGRVKNGEKYLKILSEGFSNNKFTYKAKLAYADRLYKTKKKRPRAVKIYGDVLYNTDDIGVASMASLRLANAYLDKKEPQKAKRIFEKVLKSNSLFVKENPQKSYELAKKMAKQGVYETALGIVELLRAGLKKGREDEELLKTEGYWDRLSGKSDKALKIYSEYIKKYPDGKYIKFVKKELDSIMLLREDQNLTEKLAFTNEVLEKYDDREIRKKALKEKLRILNGLKRYDEIISLKDQIVKEGLENYLEDAAEKIVQSSLRDGKCEEALQTMEDFNVTLSEKYDEDKFHCYLKSGRYASALKLSQKHVRSRDLDEKLKWLYLSAKLYARTDENKKVILAGKDILELSRIEGVKKYDDILYEMADAYYNLGEYDDLMLKTVLEIEKRFPDNIKNIDLFMKVIRYARKTKKNMLVLNFAKKIINLQKKYKIDDYSPKIEITYIHALQKRGGYKEAMREVLKLLTRKLNDKQKAEILYLAGEISLSLKQNENAKEFFSKCGEIVQDSSWQKLCAQNLELLTQ